MSERSLWNSRLGFILASAGSAVGLGAIWKFPYMAGTNGGSAFLLPYILFSVTLGLTLLIAEMCMGRSARAGAVGAYRRWGTKATAWLGHWSVLTGFMVLAFYSVVGGWCVYYLWEALWGNAVINDPQAMQTHFDTFATSNWGPVVCHMVFLLSTAAVILAGVEKGIERASKWLMPLLFIMMLVLIVRGLTLPGAEKGIEFLFRFDPSAFTSDALLNALGFSFFSLSVGSASMMNYGSYLSDKVKVGTSTAWIVFLAMLAAILGGLMIMPAVFAFGLNPNAGPGLTFATMPAVFALLPFGEVFAVIFYLCLFVAAITSSISILEMSAQFCIDEFRWSRATAVTVTTTILAVLGTLSALSFGVLADVKIFGKGFFDLFDYATSNIGMPIGVLGLAIVAGMQSWTMTKHQLTYNQEWPTWLLQFVRFIMVVVAPVVILVIMAQGFGLF